MDSRHYFKTAGRFLRGGFVAFAIMVATAPAQAASVSFFLDQSNKLPDGTNYLSVMLTENGSGGVDFLVQTLDPLNDKAGRKFGIQKFGFSFLDDSWAEIDNLPDGWRVRSNKRMDGFGKFDIRLQGKGRSRTDELSFTVDGVSLTDFDSLFSSRVAGFEWRKYGWGMHKDGWGMHMGEWRMHETGWDMHKGEWEHHKGGWGMRNWCGGKHCIESAYFAGSMQVSAIPVPPAIWLFGSGLLGLVGFARRKMGNTGKQ